METQRKKEGVEERGREREGERMETGKKERNGKKWKFVESMEGGRKG